MRELSKRVVDRGLPSECDALAGFLDAEAETSWRRKALLGGALSSRRVKDKKLKPVRLAAVPNFVNSLGEKETEAVGAILVWPGRDGYVVGGAKEFKLDVGQLQKLSEGKTLFNVACAVCHKADGTGQEGLAPPLAGSEWVAGSYDHLTRITLNGLMGPIEVAGKRYELVMPPLGALEDAQLAAILSYVQREFGDPRLAPLEAKDVKAVRDATKGRRGLWTAEELEGDQ